MEKQANDIVTYSDKMGNGQAQSMLDLLKNCPIPENELMANIGLFLNPQTLSRVLRCKIFCIVRSGKYREWLWNWVAGGVRIWHCILL